MRCELAVYNKLIDVKLMFSLMSTLRKDVKKFSQIRDRDLKNMIFTDDFVTKVFFPIVKMYWFSIVVFRLM